MGARGLQARHPSVIGAVALAVVLVDQLTKSWAVHRLSDGRTIDLVGSLRLNLTFNTGAAFSRGAGLGPVIGIAAVVVVVALVWTGRSATSRAGAVAVGLVVGGALGNLLDRAFRAGPDGLLGGAVVDFIDLQWWPVFNVADSAIVVGGLLLILTAGVSGGHRPEPDGGGTGGAGEDVNDSTNGSADEARG